MAGTIAGIGVNRRAQSPTRDALGLEAALRARIHGEVRFDDGSRVLYATDASNYRQAPIGVVIPRDLEDMRQTIALCREFGAPVLPRGGGTSLAGQCCNVAVVLDTSKHLRRIIEIDPARRIARVEPGVVLDELREQAEKHHPTFGPDPATHNRCTLGGMIGNDSCGVHSVMAGKTEENVEALEVLTYDGLRLSVGPTTEDDLAAIIAAGGRRGAIYAGMKAIRDRYAELIRARFPNIPRRVSGYNLNELLPENDFNVARALVGTEGTCATTLEATLRLVASPPVRTLVVLGYPDVSRGAEHTAAIMAHLPTGLEGFDHHLIEDISKKHLLVENRALLPDGGGWLLVEFGGESRAEANDKAHTLMDELRRGGGAPTMRLFDDPAQQKMIWEVRESGLGGTAFVPGIGMTWPGWEDSATPPAHFGAYLRDLRQLMDRFGYRGAFYGHFGQACLHTRLDFDLKTEQGIATFRHFMEEAADLVVRCGGSLSGEHGDGQSRAELLPKMYGAELVEAFHAFKAVWDPDNKMNPGKIVDPYRMDQNLRLGTDYLPARVATHFQFPEDDGDFAAATLRCVGVGKCRRGDGGIMCPSYMVTREEADSTRGRAHLLWEMLRGGITSGPWRNEQVKDALDLCLACKGCKGECPVNVDMATYKAEFLAHYYAGRLRPRTAYAMGLIYWWARLAARLPGVVNALARAPLVGDLAKWAGGIAPQRAIPAFAPQTFKQWFRERAPRNQGAAQVILWPDTFNNHFHPETAVAAVEVLEAAGFQVLVPDAGRADQTLCCGRPLYDFGMLTLAKGLLRRVLDALGPQIRAGLPVVVLEPSCCSVFRDELANLFPHDEDAQRLKGQTFLLSEFLEQKSPDFAIPPLHRKAVVHGHCHHKAVLKMGAEQRLFTRMELDAQVLDSGCCGMAGAFGFEREHYDIAQKVGERVLMPAVRRTASDTLIVADGFSCREQIAQNTERQALHPAQVLQMALRQGPDGPAGGYPETEYIANMPRPSARTVANRLLPLALVGTGAVVTLIAVTKVAWPRGR